MFSCKTAATLADKRAVGPPTNGQSVHVTGLSRGLNEQLLRAIRSDNRILAAITFASRHKCPDRLLTKSIATRLNISASRFRHLFKEQTGMPFIQCMKRERMRCARLLLQETCLTVKEVMAEINVSDRSHFSRDYKKYFGETPSITRRHASLPCKPQADVSLFGHIRAVMATQKMLRITSMGDNVPTAFVDVLRENETVRKRQ